MPCRYGSPIPCWRRLRKWQEEGVWERLWQKLLAGLDEKGKLAWEQAFLDGTLVVAKKRRSRGPNETRPREQRSKLMLLTDEQEVPVGGLVAGAQQAEVRLGQATVQTVRVPRRRRRPRSRMRVLVADRGYDSDGLRRRLRRRGIRPCTPRRRNQRQRGRKPELSAYRCRWGVERTIGWLQNYRRLVVRYERKVQVYWAFVVVAFILICLSAILK